MNKKSLENKIAELSFKMEKLKIGSEEYSRAVNDYCQLISLLKSKDEAIEDKKISEDAKFLITTALESVAIIIPIVVYTIQFKQGLKFEETGSFSSTTMRNHLSNKLKFLKLK